MLDWLLVLHIAVLGYWLGAEFVINSGYRYVCRASNMRLEERARLMDHVLDADQHVRYALVLQATLGSILAVTYGFVPGSSKAVAGVSLFGLAWLGFVEMAHRLRNRPAGQTLAGLDRATRYVFIVLLAALALGWVGADWPMPAWLRWKLAAFAGVMACGIAIRLTLLEHFRAWDELAAGGPADAGNAALRRVYRRATSILVLLWILLGVVTLLSVSKPS